MSNTTNTRLMMIYVLIVLLALPIGFLFEKSHLNTVIFTAMNSHLPQWGGAYVWSFFTAFGDTSVAVLLLWLFLPKTSVGAAQVSLAVIIGGVVSPLVKNFFDYPRPLATLGDSVLVAGPALQTHAYISGHTLTAFMVAAIIVAIYKNKWGFYALVLAALVGVSRIMVGAHWPADVLIGAVVGWCIGQFVVLLSRQLSQTFERILALIGMILVLIAIGFLAFAQMKNLEAILIFWQIVSVILATALFPQVREKVLSLFDN